MPARFRSPASPRFFARPADFRTWLDRHHATAPELWIGYYKKSSARTGLTYAEAVDEALCFGWIDGLTKSIDAHRYMQRFTPRRPGSHWSLVNVRKVARLKAAGRMQPSGLAAFAVRTKNKTGVYSFENRPEKLPPALEKLFRAQHPAWTFFCAQPPGYRRTAIWWIVSAKRDATQQRRLAQLIADSAAHRRLGMK